MINIFIEIIGWLGVMCMALNGIPQVIKTLRVKNVSGLSIWMLLLWFLGCVFLLVYTLFTNQSVVLTTNYIWSGCVSFSLIYLFLKYR